MEKTVTGKTRAILLKGFENLHLYCAGFAKEYQPPTYVKQKIKLSLDAYYTHNKKKGIL